MTKQALHYTDSFYGISSFGQRHSNLLERVNAKHLEKTYREILSPVNKLLKNANFRHNVAKATQKQDLLDICIFTT